MKQHVNDLRVATAYKKQLTDKFKLKDSDTLIDVKSKWISLETEFKIDGIKFHPTISYENQNVNTPRIIDISLSYEDGPCNGLQYKSQYVESAKVSEVSMYNIIEMCKNMKFEMLRIENDAEEWIKDPYEKRYDLPENGADEDVFWDKLLFNGQVDRNGWIGYKNGRIDPEKSLSKDSKEFYELQSEHRSMIRLLNTLPISVSPGREDTVIEGSYHLKHILERLDAWRSKGQKEHNSYFSNGSCIATLPYYLGDRFSLEEVIKKIDPPNVSMEIDKHFFGVLEYLDCYVRSINDKS